MPSLKLVSLSPLLLAILLTVAPSAPGESKPAGVLVVPVAEMTLPVASALSVSATLSVSALATGLSSSTMILIDVAAVSPSPSVI